jgi:hypothetical protein
MYTEHTHPEYEKGIVEIKIFYSILYRLIGDKFITKEIFEEYKSAFKRYNELANKEKYELVVLNEEQTHTITKLCRIN